MLDVIVSVYFFRWTNMLTFHSINPRVPSNELKLPPAPNRLIIAGGLM